MAKWVGGPQSWPVCEPVPFSVSAFAGTLVWISLSYSGFNAAVYVAGEAHDPARIVPAAMLRATVAVAIVYFALNLVFVGFVPCEDVIGRPDVAFAAASSLLGDPGAQIVRAIVALALLSSVSSMIMAGPRVFAQMADDGVFPAALKFRGQVPTAAILLQAMLAILLVLVSDLRSLLGYLGLTLSLSAALTVSCLFLLRRRHGAAAIPVTGSIVLPGIYVVATLALALLATSRQPMEWLAAGVTVASGLAVYWTFPEASLASPMSLTGHSRAGAPSSVGAAIEPLSRPSPNILHIRNILCPPPGCGGHFRACLGAFGMFGSLQTEGARVPNDIQIRDEFVQDYGEAYHQFGLPRLMGHIVAVLLTETELQSLDEITNRLQVSKGPVSQVMRRLRDHGLVEKRWVPGSRRDHYRATPDIFGQAFANHAALLRGNLDLARKYAEAARADSDEVDEHFAARIGEMQRFYELMSGHLDAFLEEWRQEWPERWRDQVNGDPDEPRNGDVS